MRRRLTWAAEGCPPYEPGIQKRLEDAFADGVKSIDAIVNGIGYTLQLRPHFRQVQKANHTKIRRIFRTIPDPPWNERLRNKAIKMLRQDPRACCQGRLRRQGIPLLFCSPAMWVSTCGMSIAWSGGAENDPNRRLLLVYMNSISFWCGFLVTVLATSAAKNVLCQAPSPSMLLRVRKTNLTSATLDTFFGLLIFLEGATLFGPFGPGAEAFSLLNRVALANVMASALAHLNLGLHAWCLVRYPEGHDGVGEPPLPLVSPMGYSTATDAGNNGSRTTGTSTSSAQPVRVDAGGNPICEDDGSRVILPPDEQPLDDKTYLMYHGTRPDAADAIERYGFMRSKRGMLGEGVYLSRDVAKAAHYPLDVPEDDYSNRVILECLVHVGKVKRIDCAGHPMQLTWGILGYDTAWVPPHCGMVPSGLEEDCVWNPERILVLRRVAVAPAAKEAAAKRAVQEQARREKKSKNNSRDAFLVSAASGHLGTAVPSTSAEPGRRRSRSGSPIKDGSNNKKSAKRQSTPPAIGFGGAALQAV